MKEVSVNEFWNGINVGEYDMQIIMNGSCNTLENVTKTMTIGENFKYKELEEKLTVYFSKYNKVLLNIPYGDIKRRFKTLTEKLGYKVERTTYCDSNTESFERVYVVLTR
jgi:hypothetical protein